MFNPEKSMLLQQVVVASQGWQDQILPWKGLCNHSPLNEPDSALPSTRTLLLREDEIDDFVNRLAPEFARPGWARHRLREFVRRQLMTAEEQQAVVKEYRG